MDQTMKTWFLRVLSGSHQDAMIELEAGPTTVGSSDNSDYVFDGLKAEQYTLTVDDALSLSVHDEIDEVYINGQNVESSEMVLKERDIISYGDIHLALGYEDTEWATVVIPVQGKEESGGQLEETEAKSASPQETQHTDLDGDLLENPEYIEGISAADRVSQRPSKSSKKRVILLPVFIFAFGLLLAVFTLLDSPDTVAQKNNQPTLTDSQPVLVIQSQEQLLQLLSDTLALKGLTASFSNKDLTWTLSGYVNTHQAKKDLQFWLADINTQAYLHSPSGKVLTVKENTRVTEQFVSNIQAAISQFGYEGLTVESTDEPGQMVIKGKLNISTPSQEQGWQQTFKQVKEDLPHITQWKNDVTFNRVVSAPKLIVNSVSLGKHPYFVDGTGTRYFVGSVYQGRYRIESITLSRLLLKYQNKVIEYQL